MSEMGWNAEAVVLGVPVDANVCRDRQVHYS
jgi:hypothetical protein